MPLAPDGFDYRIFTLENECLKVTLTDWGATWVSCVVKLADEEREILAHTELENWHLQNAYMGATIGRYANRIENGRFTLNGERYRIERNNGENTLHGGWIGADKVRWQVESAEADSVVFRYTFADGEQGFPGNVTVQVRYQLNTDGLTIEYQAVSDSDTVLNLTNHAYFNLTESKDDVRDHQLYVNADYYLPVNKQGIPSEPLTAVAQTTFDFRKAKTLRQDFLLDFDQLMVGGYDHAFLLNGHHFANFCPNLTACTQHAAARLSVEDLNLTLYTSLPALQVYSANFYAYEPAWRNKLYPNYAAVALEPEFFPDAPNRPELAKFGGILKANEPYRHFIRYVIGCSK